MQTRLPSVPREVPRTAASPGPRLLVDLQRPLSLTGHATPNQDGSLEQPKGVRGLCGAKGETPLGHWDLQNPNRGAAGRTACVTMASAGTEQAPSNRGRVCVCPRRWSLAWKTRALMERVRPARSPATPIPFPAEVLASLLLSPGRVSAAAARHHSPPLLLLSPMKKVPRPWWGA